MQPIRGSERMRWAQAWLHVVGGVVILTFLVADRGTSDRAALLVIAGALLGLAIPQFAWRGMPDWALLAFLAIGVVAVSVCVGLLRPMELAPLAYLGPFLLAAIFLSRRQIAAAYVLMLLTYGAALAFLAEPQGRVTAFVLMAATVAIIVTVVLRLRERNERLVAQLRQTATRDALTGALNPGAFEERLRAERARSVRHRRSYAVAVIDVDQFKLVNDSYGRAAGDAALVRLADLVRTNTRAGDVFARIGGEEFALLLTDADLAQGATLAEGLRGLVRRETAYDPVPLTVSIGVAAADVDGDVDAMLAADRALRGAKLAGPDRVHRGRAGTSGARPVPAG